MVKNVKDLLAEANAAVPNRQRSWLKIKNPAYERLSQV